MSQTDKSQGKGNASDNDNSTELEKAQKITNALQKQIDIEAKNVVTLADEPDMDYNPEELEDFLDLVFHAADLDEEHILTWASKSNTPSYPQSEEKTYDRMKRSKRPFAFYYGTSTVNLGDDGKLYNRKENFAGLHVIVLDDIGTKVPLEDIPEELVPNYILESSEGNYQYGYVLKEPVRDLEQAEALVHLIYSSGVSDNGGKMPTKVVRLPFGINGKSGEKRLYPVTLKESNTDYWTPDELLDVLDIGVTWEEVVKDASAITRSKNARRAGTSLWSPVRAVAASIDGVVDPLLEWLYETDKVKQDNGEWVTFECPWSHEHTTGSDTAGYSPVGRGGSFSNMRAFKCFHDSCAGRDIHDLLEMSALEGSPEVPIVDNVADLVADYAYLESEDAVVKMRNVKEVTSMKIGAFRNSFPRTASVYDSRGKQMKVKENQLWLTAPNRLKLATRRYDPAQPERVISYDGQKHLNTFTQPEWGKGNIDDKQLNVFLDFINYLIPIEAEREYFMNWLAAKAQNATFKGAALLMVAPTQGTGRTTLTDIISTLFMPQNVSKINFNTLLGSAESGNFNEWQESIMVTCDEVMSNHSNKYQSYEALKDLFDPRPKEVVINPKYGTKRTVMAYSSYILLTNHTDAIGALGDDRRVYVISNNIQRNTPEYYTALNKWLHTKNKKGLPAWCESVWRYLLTLKPDLEMLNSPAPTTIAKDTMIEETQNLNDAICDVVLNLCGGVTSVTALRGVIQDVLEEYGETDVPSNTKIIEKLIRKQTVNIATEGATQVIRVGKTVCRLRLNKAHIHRMGVTTVTKLKKSDIDGILTVSKPIIDNFIKERADTTQKVLDALAEKGL